jgi:hypothetical protein
MLLNFSPRLIDFIGQLGSPLSQPLLDQHFGNQALEPHNEAAIIDVHTHSPHPNSLTSRLYRKNWLFLPPPPTEHAERRASIRRAVMNNWRHSSCCCGAKSQNCRTVARA